jgi:FKBP-type peptidyl-prolyl cis-trans isomerase
MFYSMNKKIPVVLLAAALLVVSTETIAQALSLGETFNDGISDAAKALNHNDFGTMVSYTMGYSTGMRIQKSVPKFILEKEFIARGFQDHYSYRGSATKKPIIKPKIPLLSLEQATVILDDYHKQELALLPKDVDQWEAERPKNKSAGDIFLQKTAKKNGVLTDSRGFYYEVINLGSGPKPKITDIAEFHYRALNIEGVEIQSSFEFGRSEKYPVFESDHLGWDYALTSMSVGSKWRVYMPSNMGFEDLGRLPHLLPGSPMIFELELLSVAPHPRDLASIRSK